MDCTCVSCTHDELDYTPSHHEMTDEELLEATERDIWAIVPLLERLYERLETEFDRDDCLEIYEDVGRATTILDCAGILWC